MNSDLKQDLWLWIVGLLGLAVTYQLEALAMPASMATAATSNARLVETYGKMPLSLEVNRGQAGDQVNYYRADRFKNSRTTDGDMREVQTWWPEPLF